MLTAIIYFPQTCSLVRFKIHPDLLYADLNLAVLCNCPSSHVCKCLILSSILIRLPCKNGACLLNDRPTSLFVIKTELALNCSSGVHLLNKGSVHYTSDCFGTKLWPAGEKKWRSMGAKVLQNQWQWKHAPVSVGVINVLVAIQRNSAPPLGSVGVTLSHYWWQWGDSFSIVGVSGWNSCAPFMAVGETFSILVSLCQWVERFP